MRIPMAMTKALSARMNPVQSLGLAAQAWIAAMAGEVKYQVTAGTEDAGRRVDSVLARAVPALSRSRIKRLIEQGHARSNFRHTRPRDSRSSPASSSHPPHHHLRGRTAGRD